MSPESSAREQHLTYDYYDLGPGFQLAILRDGRKMVSFDIYHFSSVFTYNHGNPINVGETDGWYGTTTLSDEFLLPAFVFKLIRRKLEDVPEPVRDYVNGGLDEYYARHRDEYEGSAI